MNMTKQIFASMSKEYKDANPEQGLGGLGEWPEAGEHACYITGVDVVESGEFRMKEAPDPIPCVTIQFRYQLVNDPMREEPLSFVGRPFEFPDLSQIPYENQKRRVTIGLGRWAGHVKTLLQRGPSGDMEADLSAVKTLVDAGVVGVMVQCRYDKDGKYKTEYLQTLLSS